VGIISQGEKISRSTFASFSLSNRFANVYLYFHNCPSGGDRQTRDCLLLFGFAQCFSAFPKNTTLSLCNYTSKKNTKKA
jgi:hypothetical protein